MSCNDVLFYDPCVELVSIPLPLHEIYSSHVFSSLIHVPLCKPRLVPVIPVVIPDGRMFRHSVR